MLEYLPGDVDLGSLEFWAALVLGLLVWIGVS